MTVSPFDIIAVDFPFVERQGHRRRPALVLSDQARNAQTGTAIIAMITRVDAAPWPGDVVVTRFDEAGLHKPCKVRLKLHTVDLADIRRVGSLVEVDRIPVIQSLKEALPL